MEPARPDRRFSVVSIGFGVVIAVLVGWIVVAAATEPDPESVVEDFLTAVADKDVDGALELVSRYGYGVPYGDGATFLTAEAIAGDWWVASVREVEREYGSSARVEAVLAGPGGTAKGEFEVDKYDEEWLLTDPFVGVRFPASPLGYVQVNGKVLERSNGGSDQQAYSLFPGVYRFYDAVPDVVDTPGTELVAAFPLPESASNEDKLVVPAALTAGDDVVQRARREMTRRIDECAGFATAVPYGGCPFATDGEIDTPGGKRVTDLHGLKWTVARQPVVTLTDDRTDELTPGFAVTVTEPGAVTLTGTGTDTDDRLTKFTVTCDIDLTGYRAQVSADGEVTLTQSPRARAESDVNTCRRNA